MHAALDEAEADQLLEGERQGTRGGADGASQVAVAELCRQCGEDGQ